MESDMITPTIGRVVWLYAANKGTVHDIRQPCCAFIVHVWSDRMINVAYFDSNGAPFAEASVDLLQDDDPKPEGRPFATWMPYQKGQAAKAEELEAKLKSA
jgi:hypothetical protein